MALRRRKGGRSTLNDFYDEDEKEIKNPILAIVIVAGIVLLSPALIILHFILRINGRRGFFHSEAWGEFDIDTVHISVDSFKKIDA